MKERLNSFQQDRESDRARRRRFQEMREVRNQVTDELRQQIRDEQQGRCAYCGVVAYLRIHHCRPVSHGGRSNRENLCAVCDVNGCHDHLDYLALNKNIYFQDMEEGREYFLKISRVQENSLYKTIAD